ncbi:MAG TPA: hypothetical protein DDY78_16135, partial [Planctomycetales bacterium]|nr:hypothetical protein [Planctomycetales bacterium]
RVRNGEQSVRSTFWAFGVPHAEREEYFLKVLIRERFDERKPGSAFAPIGKGRKWACESATLAVRAARES